MALRKGQLSWSRCGSKHRDSTRLRRWRLKSSKLSSSQQIQRNKHTACSSLLSICWDGQRQTPIKPCGVSFQDYFTSQITIHHQRKSGKEPGGRDWSRGHGETLLTGSLPMAFPQNSKYTFPTHSTAHSGLDRPTKGGMFSSEVSSSQTSPACQVDKTQSAHWAADDNK